MLSRIDARHGALGVVPDDLDGAVVSNDFPSFAINQALLLPSFLGWLVKTNEFVKQCIRASEGTTNRVRLQVDRFLTIPIPLPPLPEQRRLVAKIEALAAKVEEARGLRERASHDLSSLLASAFARLIDRAEWAPMAVVAPQTRRPVRIEPGASYKELGVRSFGKGTFHKPSLPAEQVGSKRLFGIEPGDLVFSNVFAWEGAIAVARPQDAGRVGSHRFITCVPIVGKATAEFLRFYFLTPQGLAQIGEASPGGAGRNRTLGLKALDRLEVPVPSYEHLLGFSQLLAEAKQIEELARQADDRRDALVPSILDRAFRGEL